jgi:hypothetical protein
MATDGGPAPAPARRPRWWLRITLIVGVLVVLCCACGGVLVIRSANESGPVKRAATAYLSAVIAGDDTTARGYVCDSPAALARHLEFSRQIQAAGVKNPVLTNYSVTTWNLFSMHATVDFAVTDQTGGTSRVELPLDKRGGAWKVCG